MAETGYSAWCVANGADHAHCPEGCEHPQPFVTSAGELICGRCRHKYGEIRVMAPCVPEICGDDG